MPRKHTVVSHDEWNKARAKFLLKEKKFTRLRDELSEARRALPWEAIDRAYTFDGPDGKATLADVFDGRSQLIVYHFMFAPGAKAGCPHCSFWADNFNGIDVHLAHRDVSFLAISRAPRAKLEAFERRMGWSFKWVSSFDTDFNYDFQASFKPEDIARGPVLYNYVKEQMPMQDREGVSVFYKDAAGATFHTYSCYARGIDLLNSAYNFLDLVPKGRDEGALEFTQSWVRYHDRYEG